MTKKNNNSILDDLKKIKNQMFIPPIDGIFGQSNLFFASNEDLGLEWYDDEDYEEKEERDAVPENQNQKTLVKYLEGEKDFSKNVIRIYLEERNAECPNFPLIRKYFKKTSEKLHSLIIEGLNQYPTNIDFLCDLAYFHEFKNVINELVKHFIKALKLEENLLNFTDLCQEFYYTTMPDGYDALAILKKLFPAHTEKGKNVLFLIEELKNDQFV